MTSNKNIKNYCLKEIYFNHRFQIMSKMNLLQKSTLLTLLITFGALAIICKIYSNLAFNLQNSQIVYVNEYDTYGIFSHPFMQTLTMFIAEFICLIVFAYVKTTKNYQEEQAKALGLGLSRINIFLILIPASCDCIGAVCIYISLNFLPPSVNSILTCGIIATSAILSRIILKRRYSTKEIQGCILVLVGVSVVGLSGFLFPEESKEEEDLNMQVVSLFLMCISILLYGFQYIIEEKFFKTYYLHQLELVGYEGLWGLMIYIVICSILTFTKCPESLNNICIPHNGEYYFERADYYFQQFAESGLLKFAVILGILSVSVYNTMCQTVTKYLSCVTRALVDVGKILLIWVISLIISLNTESPNYHWENTRFGAIIIEAIGFVLVVVGEIIYNFNNSTVEKEEEEDEYSGILSLQQA